MVIYLHMRKIFDYLELDMRTDYYVSLIFLPINKNLGTQISKKWRNNTAQQIKFSSYLQFHCHLQRSDAPKVEKPGHPIIAKLTIVSQSRTSSCAAAEHLLCSESVLPVSLIPVNHTVHFIFTLCGQKLNILCIKHIAQMYKITHILSCNS